MTVTDRQLVRMVFLIALVVAFVTNAFAGEKWECTELHGSKVLVVAKVVQVKGVEIGKVLVAGTGTIQTAQYSVAGFQRRWDFGLGTDGSFRYAFVIDPNGMARYYDFSNVKSGEKVQASMAFQCKQQ